MLLRSERTSQVKALLACRIRAYSVSKRSPFFLVYGKQPNLDGDASEVMNLEAPIEDPEERIARVRTARIDSAEKITTSAIERAKPIFLSCLEALSASS